MPEQNSSQSRRPHFQRGRRGHERHSNERRTASRTQDAPASRAQPDIEQIMGEIRARIAQRHGIDVSAEQIQELAARRLGAILEPRPANRSLIDRLRHAASEPVDVPAPPQEPVRPFDESSLYASPSAALRFFRRLLRPVLALLFDPTPLVQALNTQARINSEASAREGERDRRQTEWNALHYEILQQMVLETSRISIEMQSLGTRIEALSAKVDFNERRVRHLESAPPQHRPARTSEVRPFDSRTSTRAAQPRAGESRSSETRGGELRSDLRLEPGAPPATAAIATPAAQPEASGESATAGEGARRKRRRRRGRRTGPGPFDATAAAASMTAGPSNGEESETAGVEGGGHLDEGSTAAPAPNDDERDATAAPARDMSDAPPAAIVRHSDAEAPAQPTPPPDEPAQSTPVPPGNGGPVDR